MSKPSHSVEAPSQQKNMTQVQVLDPDNGLLNLSEVAQILRVSRITVYRFVARRLLSVYKIGRRMRFRKEDVNSFMSRNRYGSTQG